MSWATAVVIIVAIWALVSIIRSRHNAALGYPTDEDGKPIIPKEPKNKKELQAEIERMRERLEVLERIATDANSAEQRESKRLSAEIENLRSRD